MSRNKKRLLVLAACLTASGPSAARADAPTSPAPEPASVSGGEPAFSIGARPVWFLLGGVTGGATVAVDQRGGFVGGELSLVRLRDGRFVGFFADATYDFGPDATYLTAGPEIGFHRRSTTGLPVSLGADVGVAVRFAEENRLGASGRLSLTLFGLFSIYGRYLFIGEEGGEHVVQAGAMLKFPLASPF
jgi:hypothetical protein